jgi:DNA polymerase III delta prime subunit
MSVPEIDDDTEVDDSLVERFGVDDARELIRKANTKPASLSKQLLVVRTNFITFEAQNALLKILEEPPSSTSLVFIVPFDFTVLPTLVSRFEFRTIEPEEEETNSEAFAEFLKASHKERLADIEQALKKQDLDWQRAMKQGLIEYLKQRSASSTQVYKNLELAARLLLTRGSSNKLLFEHVALTLPVR